MKIFIQCRYIAGSFIENPETTEIGWFTCDDLPDNLASEKVTKEQILMCFKAYADPAVPTIFD